MDLNDLWQEHKTWILGVVGGLVIFLIANSMISSKFDVGPAYAKMGRARSKISGKEFYSKQTKFAAIEEGKELAKRLEGLEKRCYFAPGDDFLFEGKGDFSAHYIRLTTRITTELKRSMNAANVDFLATSLGLPSTSPTDRDEAQTVLLGLDIVQDALRRLLTASGSVLDAHPGQHGLRAVDSIKILAGAGNRRFRRAPGRKTKVDLGQQVSASLTFRADSMTLERFLDLLRASQAGGDSIAARPILLRRIKVEDVGREPGEPLKVSCELLGLIRKGN